MKPEEFIAKHEAKGTGHSWYSPSSAARLIACPGSLVASADFPDKSSEVADQGTKCHEYMEMVYKGRTWESLCAYAKDNFTQPWQDNACASAIVMLNDLIAEVAPEMMELEVNLELGNVNYPGVRGTCDVLILANQTLYVVDYKFGMGDVYSRGNYQLLTYATMALQRHKALGNEVDHVELIICQPRRSEKLRRFEYTQGEVSQWAEQYLFPSVNGILSEPMISTFNPGSSQCHFCPCAVHGCEHQQKVFVEAVGAVEVADKALVVQPDMELENVTLSNEELAYNLSRIPWLKECIARFEQLALDRMEAGRVVPGYKVVDKIGNKKWLDEKKASTYLKRQKLKVADIYTKKLVSPSVATKLLKITADDKREKYFSKLFERPVKGKKIVVDNDSVEVEMVEAVQKEVRIEDLF